MRPTEPRTGMPRDDVDHQHGVDNAAVHQVGRAWTGDAQFRHEVLSLQPLGCGHALARVNVDRLADGGLKQARRVWATVLYIFASMHHCPRPWLADGDGVLPSVAMRVHWPPIAA